MTVEEKQCGSKPASGSEDELDDIDKVRDDLQSTKQLLQEEISEKLRLKNENERLLEELAKMKKQMASMVNIAPASDGEDPLVAQLRQEAEAAKAAAAKQEFINQSMNQQLGLVQAQLEDTQHRCLMLEKRTGGSVPETCSSSCQTTDLQRTESKREARREQTPLADSEEEEEEEETEEEETEEEEEDENTAKQTEELRALRMQQAKLRTFKEKILTSLDEKRAMRFQVNNLQKALRQEQKRFSTLQREVSKMTKEEDVSDDDEEEEESSESESESETESEPESDAEDMSDPPQFRTEALIKKNKVHENRLNLIKKGNYLLKATVDKLKESLEKQQHKTLDVQQELNTIVCELG
jgi:hypothetical protein